MAVKPHGEVCSIREQIIEDPVTGLTIQFAYMPGSDAPFRLRLFGKSLPHGNREILFDPTGAEAGAGVATMDACRPTWLREVG